MITLNKEFRQLFSFFFICMLLFSCKKSQENTDRTLDPQEFINYTIDGANYSYSSPVDAIGMNSVDTMENNTFVSNYRINSTGQLDANHSVLSFTRQNIAVNSDQLLGIFGTTNLLGAYNPLLAQSPINVHITEFGQIGEFIAGNFNGILFEVQSQNHIHNVSCSFRVRRTN